jgi:lysyl-tRNA synthetase class I
MGAVREKAQADFDLERFIDMFDEALTSNDERVVNALRSLMMMVILTKPETRKDAGIGPLRQLYDDLHNLNRRMHGMEDALRQIEYRNRREEKVYSARDYWGPNPVTMSDEEYMETLRQINSPGKMK